MNITELIVELLQNGQKVELPGIGTFDSEVRAPHHDPATHTYYPSTRSIVFSDATSGEGGIVDVIAQRECVSASVAKQMWRNYVDAVADKISRTGEHCLGDLGRITKQGDRFAFDMAEGVVIDAGNGSETPLKDVKTYDHSGSDDPFAQFESAPMPETPVTPTPTKPEPMPEPETETEPEPEPEPMPEPVIESEPEPIPAPEPEPIPEPEPEPISEPEPIPAPEPEPIPAPEPEPEPVPIFNPEPSPAPVKEVKEKKRRGRGLLWLLLLLLILLLAGACWYFMQHRDAIPADNGEVAAVATKHLRVPVTNELTYNPDMIEYSDREIARSRDMVCANMTEYIYDFLARRNYTNARVSMMDRVGQYAEERLNQLMGDRFAVQRFIPYDDYIYNQAEGWLKRNYADKARHIVQGELMNIDALDVMLNNLVNELGLEMPEPQQRTAAEVQQVKATEREIIAKRNTQQEKEIPAVVEKNSKHGFDIIAGFYLNRNSAAKMASRLHELGCDAYIIEKNDMFYVSMGSAPTRTKAEALYNHIKSWYDGDIAIKEL